MTQLLTVSAVGMAVVFFALLATIVVRRFLADRRRRREERLRPQIEIVLAEYLASEHPEPPQIPEGDAARDLLRTVALETIGELRGRERGRVVSLLERVGIVAEAAADLRSSRRRVRRAAAEALRQIGSEQSEQALSDGLRDSDLDTSLSCAAALAGLPAKGQLASVLALADRAARDRPGAVAAILVTLGHRHPAAIGEALSEGASPELRRLAAAVAGELRLAGEIPRLREALGSEDDELTARAARGLGMIGDDGALAPLLALLEAEDRPWFVRLAATDALGAIGDSRALVPLEQELKSPDWLLQAKAARALRLLGSEGEGVLRRASRSPEVAVRGHARMALER
jgi:HEAT repeat protein